MLLNQGEAWEFEANQHFMDVELSAFINDDEFEIPIRLACDADHSPAHPDACRMAGRVGCSYSSGRLVRQKGSSSLSVPSDRC